MKYIIILLSAALLVGCSSRSSSTQEEPSLDIGDENLYSMEWNDEGEIRISLDTVKDYVLALPESLSGNATIQSFDSITEVGNYVTYEVDLGTSSNPMIFKLKLLTITD